MTYNSPNTQRLLTQMTPILKLYRSTVLLKWLCFELRGKSSFDCKCVFVYTDDRAAWFRYVNFLHLFSSYCNFARGSVYEMKSMGNTSTARINGIVCLSYKQKIRCYNDAEPMISFRRLNLYRTHTHEYKNVKRALCKQ